MPARIGPHRLTGIAAPLAVWALHFLAVYVMHALACAEGWQRARVGGLEMVIWWLLLATALAIAAIVWLGLRARRVRRHAPPAGNADTDARRRRFTATLTAATALLALIAVAFTALPILLLPPCT